ncbi:MAG: hypothetical protein R3F20_05275 [Planctomycetota bacterium]
MSRTPFLLLVLFLAAAPLAAQTYEDEELGFSVKSIKDWDQVPPEPTEKNTVARWASPRDERDFPCRMFVHVFERVAEKPAEGELPRYDFGTYRDFRAWSKWNRREMALPEKGEKLKVKAPKDLTVEAERFEITYDSGYTLGGKPLGNFYSQIAIVRTPRREFVIELYCGEISKKKFKRQFDRVIESFELLENAGDKKKKSSEELNEREQARERARKEATKVEGWWFVETENYIIVTNVDAKKKSLIRDLEKRLEALREEMERDIPPVRPITAVSIVRVCKDRDTYLKYGAPPGSAGYWYPAAQELVLYAEGQKDRTRSTLYHEGFHQYIHYAMGEVSPCICLNEGGAEYYGGADISGTKVRDIEKNKESVNPIREAIRKEGHVPLKDILQWSQSQYYSRSDLCYPQGWSIYYFLREGLAPGHPWENILPTYWETLRSEVRKIGPDDSVMFRVDEIRQAAFEAAFKDMDWEAFEKAWIAFTMDDVKAKS